MWFSCLGILAIASLIETDQSGRITREFGIRNRISILIRINTCFIMG